MSIHSIIQTRRDGLIHTHEQIDELVKGAVDGSIRDYQLSAWLMAAFLNPLSPEETAMLTRAMAESGDRLDLSSIPAPRLDKHSTGGVGDKTSIALLPILASCGAHIVKMSGRGLGITGGTIDKLSAIPGFRLDFTPEQLMAQASKIGVALSGQTPLLAPADKVLYALRDATDTVESTPLIVSSILSKKMAVGADTIVLDVKCGSGAFMKDLDSARELATSLKNTAQILGLNVHIALTDMSVPLGKKVGNTLELEEAFDTLKGLDTGRFRQLCISLAGIALTACGLSANREEGEQRAIRAIQSGDAKAKAREWIEAQGGNAAVLDDYSLMPHSPCSITLRAGQAGWVRNIQAQTIGEAAIELGAGRKRKEDDVILGAGFELHVECGDEVQINDPLITIYGDTEAIIQTVAPQVQKAIEISPGKIEPRLLILDVF